VAGAPAAEAAAARPLTETEVTVKTPDGICDAAFVHPATGIYPGVLIWPDAFGLRPSMREFAQTDRSRRLLRVGAQSVLPHGEGASVF